MRASVHLYHTWWAQGQRRGSWPALAVRMHLAGWSSFSRSNPVNMTLCREDICIHMHLTIYIYKRNMDIYVAYMYISYIYIYILHIYICYVNIWYTYTRYIHYNNLYVYIHMTNIIRVKYKYYIYIYIYIYKWYMVFTYIAYI